MAEEIKTVSEEKTTSSANNLVLFAGALGIALLIFYGLDHFIMSIQGLPLNLNLTPAS